jgi:hypothetical protein
MAVAVAGIALVGASARAQSEQAVLAPSVFATRTVPAGAIRTSTVTCRPGFVAVSAGVSSRAPGTTLLARTPVGSAGYRFRIGNPEANGDRQVTLVVACRKVAGNAPVVLRLKQMKPVLLTVPARSKMSAVLLCPPGTTPANGGFDLRPGAKTATSFSGLSLSLRTRTATLTSVRYVIANRDRFARKVALQGACLTLFRAASGPAQRLHFARTTFRVPLRPGLHTIARSCPSGWFALDAGFALRSSTTVLGASAASGRGGRWTLENNAGRPVLVDVQLACGRVAP